MMKELNAIRTDYKLGLLSIAGLILAVIFVVIALALAPTIADQASSVGTNPNVTSAGQALFNLTPTVYAAVVIVAMLAAFGLGG